MLQVRWCCYDASLGCDSKCAQFLCFSVDCNTILNYMSWIYIYNNDVSCIYKMKIDISINMEGLSQNIILRTTTAVLVQWTTTTWITPTHLTNCPSLTLCFTSNSINSLTNSACWGKLGSSSGNWIVWLSMSTKHKLAWEHKYHPLNGGHHMKILWYSGTFCANIFARKDTHCRCCKH
jgi:hypothetical protein